MKEGSGFLQRGGVCGRGIFKGRVFFLQQYQKPRRQPSAGAGITAPTLLPFVIRSSEPKNAPSRPRVCRAFCRLQPRISNKEVSSGRMSSHGFLPSAKIVSFVKLIGAGSKLLQNSDLRDLMCFKVSAAPALQDVPDLLKNLKRNGHKAFRTTPIDSISSSVYDVACILYPTFYDCPLNFISNSESPSFLPPSLLSLFPSFLLSFRIIPCFM